MTPLQQRRAEAISGFPPQTSFRSAYSWHSLWSQYLQLVVGVQRVLGYSEQNFGEQSVLVEGAEQSLDGRRTLKV